MFLLLDNPLFLIGVAQFKVARTGYKKTSLIIRIKAKYLAAD